jgi:predicted amidophosphoribosyltransferase
LDVRCVRALARVRYTPAQGSPGAVSRTDNVRAAFRSSSASPSPHRRSRVWLVDDVVTSGATASECARI